LPAWQAGLFLETVSGNPSRFVVVSTPMARCNDRGAASRHAEPDPGRRAGFSLAASFITGTQWVLVKGEREEAAGSVSSLTFNPMSNNGRD
jgi:hypothetical protein